MRFVHARARGRDPGLRYHDERWPPVTGARISPTVAVACRLSRPLAVSPLRSRASPGRIASSAAVREYETFGFTVSVSVSLSLSLVCLANAQWPPPPARIAEGRKSYEFFFQSSREWRGENFAKRAVAHISFALETLTLCTRATVHAMHKSEIDQH